MVGVQPFGGEGLSGTGPKAGGPLYLLRLLARARRRRHGGAAPRTTRGAARAPLRGCRSGERHAALRGAARLGAAARPATWPRAAMRLAASVAGRRAGARCPGPPAKRNLYAVLPREAVLCLAEDEATRPAAQLAAVLAVGAGALAGRGTRRWPSACPTHVRERIALAQDWAATRSHFDAVLHHGDAATRLRGGCARWPQRPGPIVGVTRSTPGDMRVPLERLVVERALSVNTAAAGGNASLMTIG